jgi:16S rRNA (adenine(1408)-N(1))-methyltransferase
METIRGKTSHTMDATQLHERLANHQRLILDLGTGDGKFALCHAVSFPNDFVIGIDSCRENLRNHSRTNLPNLLYVIANAQCMPQELSGLVSQIVINFPWGSLLESLLDGNLMPELESALGAGTRLEVRLNRGALTESGWEGEAGIERVRQNLSESGWRLDPPVLMDASALRKFPSTWAKRLAFGRDPHAVQLSGCKL